jgi:cell division control protein 6
MFDDRKAGADLLRSQSVLTSDYQPEEPVGREAEISRIVDALRPLSRRQEPENLLVYGPAGVGKTTCVRRVIDKFEEESRERAVYINCWQYNTRPSLLTELLIQLGYPAPRKGKPVDELLSKLREWLDKNRAVAVVLDEFDQLESQTETIYDLQLVNEEADNPLGTIMVSNQQPNQIDLEPRSKSRLNCRTLQFKPYSVTPLKQILEDRVEQAFKPGAVTDEAVEKIARQVAESSGDCRQALEKLLRTGRKAEQEGKKEITADIIHT